VLDWLYNFMRQLHRMKWSLTIGMAIGLGLYVSFSHAGTSGDRRSMVGPAISSVMTSAVVVTATETGTRHVPSTFLPWDSTVVMRTIPTVSKQISVGGTTLVPYIGAGFSGGYATELDRSLHVMPAASELSNSTNIGLRSLVGQHLLPNEVQLGIRFPF
jgi:hypothetical protein